jgi:hypothetical protein
MLWRVPWTCRKRGKPQIIPEHFLLGQEVAYRRFDDAGQFGAQPLLDAAGQFMDEQVAQAGVEGWRGCGAWCSFFCQGHGAGYFCGWGGDHCGDRLFRPFLGRCDVSGRSRLGIKQ